MKNIRCCWRKLTEGIAAVMLAAIFFTFLIQIFSRYILVEPFGWTLEVCLTLWVWLIFWSNALVLKHSDHVTFDVIYFTVQPKIRKILALFGAISILITFTITLYPTWDFIDFLKIKKSTVLQIPMRTVFSIYMLFIVATIAIYVFRTINIIRFGLSDGPPHIIPAGNIDKHVDTSNQDNEVKS